MLGSAVLAAVDRTSAQVFRTVIKAGWLHLDVRDRDAVHHVVSVVRPDLVIHLAAETDLEACESDPMHSWLTNAAGAEHVARAAAAVGATLVDVSSGSLRWGCAQAKVAPSCSTWRLKFALANRFRSSVLARSSVPPGLPLA
ncbi:sugar nucleotide-binding protein [Verrucosispora sp. WMMD703]|uniref:sugar nucleotide-binding protein n=1 Tax=Verrucosispora sp. WMMD703 TaxID=3403463 RepID=UPI003B94229C